MPLIAPIAPKPVKIGGFTPYLVPRRGLIL